VTYYKTQAEMAKAFGVTRQAVGKWAASSTFPKRAAAGFPVDGVTTWVEAKNEREIERADATGDKAEELRLKCERLRVAIKREQETLKQAVIETKRLSGKLHEVAPCEKEWQRAGMALRGRVDSWQQHQTAKDPDSKKMVDGLCESFLEALESVV
jgi:hypothetical protein